MNSTSKLPQSFRKAFRTRTRYLGGVALALGLGHIQLALAQDPIITLQPSNQTAYVGAHVRFRVAATTTNAPISLQWQRDDPTVPVTFTNIPNAYGGSFNLPSVTFEHTGDYRVIVANAVGDTVTSEVAHLEVNEPPFTKITEGPLVNTASDTWYGHWGDYDNDGRLDVLVKGGPGHWRLYHNDGGTSFSAVTNGVMGEWGLRSMWAIWTDPDNDGDLDAWVWGRMGDGRAAMHWNNGSGDFTRVIADGGWVEGYQSGIGPVSSWGDFDGDGFLDAFLNFGTPGTPRLLHNNGDRTFAFVADSVLNSLDDQSQVSGAVDYDNDGDLDLIPVRYGGGSTRFYRNDGQGNFEEATPEPIRSELTHSLISAWGDFDNDGDLDVIFGGWSSLSERFYLNNGDGTFTRWSGQPALFEPHTDGSGSSLAWGDFDNDGYLDLVVSKGDPAVRLWRNQGDGDFAAVDAGDLTRESGIFVQSCGWVDFNEDGSLDLFVCSLNGGKDKLFMGNGNGNRWLEVKPKGVVSNRLAVGARIFATASIRGQVMRQMRVITASDSDQTLLAHFGLGDATKVDTLRIEWPSGTVQELRDVATNQILTVTEPPRLVPQSAGKFQIQCWVNQSFEVQCSADLITWAPVATVTNLTGTLIFDDVEAAHHECRYYRVVEARPNMVWIPPGTFLMGSPEDEVDRRENEGPQTQVTLTKGFWMGKYEVTQGEYLDVMGNNPSFFNGLPWEGSPDYGVDLNRPVETVSWDDAVGYCAALTERERLAGRIAPNSVYRLPTEAEWEYACRGWTSTRFSYGDDPGYTNSTNYVWHYDNSGGQTHPVGQKLPNPWGLYDMHGNVFEWCQDWYGDYSGGVALDPQRTEAGSSRVSRGGGWYGWFDYAGYCRSAFRSYGYPDDRGNGIGIRVVLAPGQP